MQTRVVVVTLEFIRDDEYYDDYYQTTAMQKLFNLMDRLHFVCAELQVKEPDAKWLVVWPEHGITNEEKTCLNAREKKTFKWAMQDVTRRYPQLTIIAGTVPTVREAPAYFTRNGVRKAGEKIESISRAYMENQWIAIIETQEQMDEQYMQHADIFRDRSTLSARAIIRNTAYVFMQGECIARHDKMAPFSELERYPREHSLFQTAKGRNASSHVTIEYPDGVRIPICIEICREHGVGVAKREYFMSQLERPVIHFVLSDRIEKENDFIIGEYFMHSDTGFISELRQMDDSPFSVVHYSANLLKPEARLSGPNEVLDERRGLELSSKFGQV